MSQQFEGGAETTEFEGEFQSENVVAGTYKSNRPDFDQNGVFTLEKTA